VDGSRLARALPGLRAEPVGGEEAKAASSPLLAAGLHGHTYAIDAVVEQTAVRQRGPVTLPTSDVDDMVKLCGDRVRAVRV
jgi:hypothetical protein